MSHSIGLRTVVLAIVCGLVIAEKNGKFHGAPDGIVFPGPIDKNAKALDSSVSPEGDSELAKQIQLAKKISSLDSVDELLRFIGEEPPREPAFALAEYDWPTDVRLGPAGSSGQPALSVEQRSNAERPSPAKCMPELQPVPLNQENDPSTIYFPSCTRIRRCGGCCDHSLLSCQPTATEIRNFEVIVLSINSSNTGLHRKYKLIVPLEEHTKCQCDCKIKPEHCNEKQSYVPEECRCTCNNVDEAEKCRKDSNTKIWNPEHCVCYCREERECNTGYYFDQNTCRCRQGTFSRARFQPTSATNYGFGQTPKLDLVPPVIIALDAADPRRKPKPDPDFK